MELRTQNSEIVARLARRMATDEATAAKWVEAVTETLYETIQAGESVTLRGFGNFYVKPMRGDNWVFKFNPAQRLRAALNWSSTYKNNEIKNPLG